MTIQAMSVIVIPVFAKENYHIFPQGRKQNTSIVYACRKTAYKYRKMFRNEQLTRGIATGVRHKDRARIELQACDGIPSAPLHRKFSGFGQKHYLCVSGDKPIYRMIKVAALQFNPIQENTYVVWDDTNRCAVIDAGNSTPREDAALDNFIREHDLQPELAVNTHGHFDHTLGVEHLRRTYGIPFALSGKDRFLLENARTSGDVFGVSVGEMPAIDLDLDTVEEVRFGDTVLRVIPTPGHTPGHVSLYEPVSKTLFTGDTLFRESIGRTDLPGGDYSWIMRSILERILPLVDDVRVYPGHGEPTTIGHEALYNPFVVEVLNDEVNYRSDK